MKIFENVINFFFKKVKKLRIVPYEKLSEKSIESGNLEKITTAPLKVTILLEKLE